MREDNLIKKLAVLYDLNFLAKEGYGGISRMWAGLFGELPGRPVAPTFLLGDYENETRRLLEKNNFFGGAIRREGALLTNPPRFWLPRAFSLMNLKAPAPGAIFHSTDFICPLWARSGWRFVTTIHDMVFWDQARRIRKNYEWVNNMAATYHSLRVSDRVVAVSQATRDAILRKFPWAEPKIVVSHHGLAPGFFRAPAGVPREKSFLFMGARNAHKNYELLLEAFAAFARRRGDWSLWAVGENKHSREEEARAYRKLGIAERVRDFGPVAEERLRDLLAHAGAVVIPSFNEGFNFPLLEAMASGAPVLSSDIPVSRELGKEYARYFSPHSAQDLLHLMQELAAAPPPERLIDEARCYAAGFTWKASMDRLMGVYRSCIERGRTK